MNSLYEFSEKNMYIRGIMTAGIIYNLLLLMKIMTHVSYL